MKEVSHFTAIFLNRILKALESNNLHREVFYVYLKKNIIRTNIEVTL